MLTLILTDAATRMDDQDDDKDFFLDRCGRLVAECKKLRGVGEVNFVGNSDPPGITISISDDVDEGSLLHVIDEIAETLKIVVDGNAG